MTDILYAGVGQFQTTRDLRFVSFVASQYAVESGLCGPITPSTNVLVGEKMFYTSPTANFGFAAMGLE